MAKVGTTRFLPLTHEGAAFAAAALTRDQPRRPMTPDRLLLTWTNTEQVLSVCRFSVEAEGGRAGWTSVVQLSPPNQQHAVVHLVLPAAPRGLYDATAAFAVEQAREMGVKTVSAQIWEDNPSGLESLRASGWEQKRKQRYWRLELGPNRQRVDLLAEAARERVKAAGVEITTADAIGGSAMFPALYEINSAANRDIPAIVPFEMDPYEVWLTWMQPPAVLTDRIWVTRADGQPVGFSFLAFRPGLVETGFTGVLREHRNKGIARALKLETLRQAVSLGVDAVETDNDSENAPILHLNEEIGYREVPGQIEFLKQIG